MSRDYPYTKTDDELLLCVRLNDCESSFSVLYDRYWDKSLGIAYNLTHDKSQAKDIVQDVFISFWNRRNTLEINNFSNYLATSIKFSFFVHIEKERRRRIIREEKLDPQDEAILDEQIETLFCADYFSNLLESLPEKCRLVISYSRLDDMKISEIAEKMNISEKTVEGHLTKGLKIIRAKFRIDLLLLTILYAMYLHDTFSRQ
ncbi:MAG: polymerase sigma-70 factor [Bacteroidetes bacterium]|jgi:RNA polymerase sigma-70 factor (family 1)|nr:polymerase sigma-70 factor [Bacteroidota bacterium]